MDLAATGILHASVEGVLLAALLAATWELESTVIRARWPAWSPFALAFGAPVTLLLVTFWGAVRVPAAVMSLALAAAWLLVSARTWRWVGVAAVLTATFVQSQHLFGWSLRMDLNLLVMAGTTLILALTAGRRARFGYALGIYLIAVASGVACIGLNRDPLYDFGTSAVAAGFLAVYILGRVERERRSQRDVYRAEHDALTGALSRYGLEAWLNRTRSGAARSGLVVACDLDDFKRWNDTWGHDVGDRLLQAFARRLAAELRADDALVRPGGDEFVVWIPGTTAEDSPALVHRLHRAVSGAAYDLPGGPAGLGVSMGWAVGVLDAATATAADQALLLAKREGKNRVHPAVAGTASAEGVSAPEWSSYGRLGWLCQAARLLWADWGSGAVLTDVEGRIVAANPTYERLTGLTWPELAERTPGVASSGETGPEVYRRLWETLSKGRSWQGCLKNRRPDGSPWLAAESITPIKAGREVIGYWAEVVDAEQAGGPHPYRGPGADRMPDADVAPAP